MQWQRCLLLSLFLTASSDQSELQLQPAKNSCYLLTEIKMSNFCMNGIYTRQLKIKYKDRRVNIGDIYGVWLDTEQKNHMLIWFYEPSYAKCRLLEYNKNNRMKCSSSSGVSYLQVLNTKIFCFSFNVQYVDDLMNECIEQGNMRVPFRIYNTYSALMYVGMDKTRSKAQRTESSGWPAILASVTLYVVAEILQMP